MGIKITNNAASLLTTALSNVDTSCSVTVGTGALYPTLGVGDYFYATIQDASNRLEIIKVTARSADGMTIERAQEGTTALSWSAGDILELRMTAQTFRDVASDGTVVKTGNTGSAVIPARTTTQRNAADPAPYEGLFGYNSTTRQFEGHDGTAWGGIGGGATGGGVDKVFVENDTLVTTDYLLGQGAITLPVTANVSNLLTSTAHGFIADQLVQFATTTTLPAPLLVNTGYYVISSGLTADAFKVSDTQGGTEIDITTVGTGTHTVGKLKNASSAGAISIATGVTVTIPTNATWVIS